jgi:hypothetical protein
MPIGAYSSQWADVRTAIGSAFVLSWLLVVADRDWLTRLSGRVCHTVLDRPKITQMLSGSTLSVKDRKHWIVNLLSRPGWHWRRCTWVGNQNRYTGPNAVYNVLENHLSEKAQLRLHQPDGRSLSLRPIRYELHSRCFRLHTGKGVAKPTESEHFVLRKCLAPRGCVFLVLKARSSKQPSMTARETWRSAGTTVVQDVVHW